MNARTAILLIVCVALVGAPAARASEGDDAALRKDVRMLIEMVQDLQRRVSALEAHAVKPASAPTAAPQPGPVAPIAAARPGMRPDYVSPEAMLKANWNQIDKGMDEAAIKALIGAPSTTFQLDGRLVWYYYYPGTGRGSVFFTDAGRVSSYQSPFPEFGW